VQFGHVDEVRVADHLVLRQARDRAPIDDLVIETDTRLRRRIDRVIEDEQPALLMGFELDAVADGVRVGFHRNGRLPGSGLRLAPGIAVEMPQHGSTPVTILGGWWLGVELRPERGGVVEEQVGDAAGRHAV